jgi:hypothetical protein
MKEFEEERRMQFLENYRGMVNLLRQRLGHRVQDMDLLQ